MGKIKVYFIDSVFVSSQQAVSFRQESTNQKASKYNSDVAWIELPQHGLKQLSLPL